MSNQAYSSLRKREHALAEKITELQYSRQAAIWKPYGRSGYEKSVRDAAYHLSYLAEAVAANEPALYIEYLGWVKVLFAGLKFPEEALVSVLECTREVLSEDLPVEEQALALEILDKGVKSLAEAALVPPSFIEGDTSLDNLARQYLRALLHGDRQGASKMILNEVQNGESIRNIYKLVFERTQREIGRLWQINQINVAQEHFCTAATQMIMSQLYPFIFSGQRKERRLVVACVGGELHEIGARMVADFFEMEGWDSHFLGANTPPESVVAAVLDKKADLLALSATMTFHIGKVTEIIAMLRAREASARTPVLVGGYPFNLSPALWEQVGADGYAPDAETAIQEAAKLIAV